MRQSISPRPPNVSIPQHLQLLPRLLPDVPFPVKRDEDSSFGGVAGKASYRPPELSRTISSNAVSTSIPGLPGFSSRPSMTFIATRPISAQFW